MNLIFNRNHKTTPKNYCVIGLGRFGGEIAKILQREKQNLLVIDSNETVISTRGHEFNEVMLLDACNINDLAGIGISDFDQVIVAVTDFERSITICSNLRELGVKNIFAKATTTIHQRILKSMGINKTIIPEIELASRVAYKIIYGLNIDLFNFSSDKTKSNVVCFMIEIPMTNKYLAGKTIANIDLIQQYQASIVAIKRPSGEFIVPVQGNNQINIGDLVFVLTKKKNVNELADYFKG